MPKIDMARNDDGTFLCHYGVDGMHWGVRRYQNYDGSLTPEGYKHWGLIGPRKTKAEKSAIKKERQQAKNLRKARAAKKAIARKEQKAVKDAENLIKKKQRIFERGDAKEIYRNRKLFTTEEYQKAMLRAEAFKKSTSSDDGKIR